MLVVNDQLLLTVRDIAACIAFDRSKDGIDRTIRQVRHWTQSDLLRPVSAKATGTGTPRLYPEESTIEIAALLLELTRYGATVDILKPVAEDLYEEYEDGAFPFTIAQTDEGEAYAQVAWHHDPKTGKLTDAKVNFFTQTDLEGDIGELLSEPSSSILINMNQVMERVFPLPWRR